MHFYRCQLNLNILSELRVGLRLRLGLELPKMQVVYTFDF